MGKIKDFFEHNGNLPLSLNELDEDDFKLLKASSREALLPQLHQQIESSIWIQLNKEGLGMSAREPIKEGLDYLDQMLDAISQFPCENAVDRHEEMGIGFKDLISLSKIKIDELRKLAKDL